MVFVRDASLPPVRSVRALVLAVGDEDLQKAASALALSLELAHASVTLHLGIDREAALAAVLELLAEDARDDELRLLYLGGHAYARGDRLYFAAADTNSARVPDTGLDVTYLAGLMPEGCRHVLVVDAPYAGLAADLARPNLAVL